MIEASMTSRSSYATGLDTVYLGSEPTAAITIPLTLNGNTFVGIEGLREGEDYTYDAVTSSLALSATYLSAVYDQLDDYGQVADIVMNFSSGAPWHQYLIRSDAPTLDESAGSATGSQDSGMSVPVAFNGNIVKSATAFQTADGAERRVGPNSDWWEFLQYGGSFTADYSANTFTLLPSFFSDPSVTDGDMRVHLTFFDGSELDILLNVSGGDVTVRQ
jgi:endoglucanase